MLIPLFSPTIQRSEMDAVLTCLVEEKVGPGEMADRLEKKTCEIFEVPFAVALRSPALALDRALQLLNLQAKTPIMLSALAPAWHYQQILRSGFTPVVLDVDKKTALIEAATVEAAIKQGGRVLLLHDTLGNIPNYESFLELGIPIIEDISQSAGGYYADREILDPLKALQAGTKTSPNSASVHVEEHTTHETEHDNDEVAVLKRVGSFCTFTILGLEERDTVTGGGGALLFVSEKRAVPPLRDLAAQLSSTDKLPDINAALAFVQLKSLKKNMEARLELEALFKCSIISSKHETLNFLANTIHAVYGFPVILNRGYKEVEKYTRKKQIETALAFRDSVVSLLGDELKSCENAKAFALRTVLFPLYPRLGAKRAGMLAKILTTLP